MDEIDLIVWDLETSGFNAPKDKILEIGARIFTKQGEKPEEKQWILQNNIILDPKIIEINGITSELITKEGRDPKQCIEEFLPLLMNAKRHVTHNGISFDIPFLTNYVADLLKYSDAEKIALTTTLRQKAFDTAIHFKAKKLKMTIGPCEPFDAFANRVLEIRAQGVKYNLGLCCDESEIDRSKVVQHRALADVYLTWRLYDLITTPQLFETPYSEN